MDGLHNNLLGLGEHEYLGWRFNLTFAVSTQGQSLKKKFKKPYQVNIILRELYIELQGDLRSLSTKQ